MVGEEITLLVKADGWKKIVSGSKIFRSIPGGIMNEGLSSTGRKQHANPTPE